MAFESVHHESKHKIVASSSLEDEISEIIGGDHV